MTVYERSTVVDAPLSRVWEFHSTVDGLLAITPTWMHLRVDSVLGPDGEHDPDVLETGARISLSIRPFGVGTRQSWDSVILERDRTDGSGYFRDEMRDGPFEHWEHTHRFRDMDGRTVMLDHVEYELRRPIGSLSGFARPFFELMFRGRHKRVSEQLE